MVNETLTKRNDFGPFPSTVEPVAGFVIHLLLWMSAPKSRNVVRMNNQHDENEVLARCLRGEQAAWGTFVETYSRYVYFLIQVTARKHGAIIDEEECADLHNDLFLALLEDDSRRLRAFRGQNGCSIRSWIRVITIRRTIDALRKRRKMVSLSADGDDSADRELPNDAPDPLEQMVEREGQARHGRLSELTEKLPDGDRLLLHLLYVEKLDASAVAATLRINKGAVYTRKTRLIKRLRHLADEAGLLSSDD